MLTLGAALHQGTELLRKAGIEPARLTAELLLGYATQKERTFLYAHSERVLSELEWIHYGRYLHERLRRKPLQYITGKQEFFGRDFRVTPEVLIPRPETEVLVEKALPIARNPGVTVDVGTGSGAIAATLALEGARMVVGIDLSASALALAQSNAAALGASVHWIHGDALEPVRSESVSLVVSNPPYLAELEAPSLQPEVRDWEPRLALFAGEDGLAFYRRLLPDALRVLHAGGWLAVEVGAGQSGAVADLLSDGWSTAEILRDLAGIDRVILAEKRF